MENMNFASLHFKHILISNYIMHFLVAPIHQLKLSSKPLLVCFLQPLTPTIGFLEVGLHAAIISRPLLHKILAHLNL